MPAGAAAVDVAVRQIAGSNARHVAFRSGAHLGSLAGIHAALSAAADRGTRGKHGRDTVGNPPCSRRVRVSVAVRIGANGRRFGSQARAIGDQCAGARC